METAKILQVCALITLVAVVAVTVIILVVLRSNNKRREREKKQPHLLTFRISNIPKRLTDLEFRDILLRLPDEISESSGTGARNNLAGWSFAPAAASTLSDRFSVATATFHSPPTISHLETAIKREVGPEAGRVRVDLDFLGFTPLADCHEGAAVDIIAVTGLAGHAFGSWKSKGHQDMWLRDFLPESIPNARILTYGYDTKLHGSQSDASILDYSRTLLESIKITRSQQVKHWPLILIGHGVGGLIVKQALVQAADGSPDDKAVFMACYAVVLFGVPNRGLENSALISMVKGRPNEDLVGYLGQSSRFASLLHENFFECFTHDSKIICFYETRRTRTHQWNRRTGAWERTGPEIMLVPHTSAVYAGKNEKVYDQIPIDANNSNIVKFGDPSEHYYLIVERRLKDLVTEAPSVIKERFMSYSKKMSEMERKCIEVLKSPDYVALGRYDGNDPSPGICRRILDRELAPQCHQDKEYVYTGTG